MQGTSSELDGSSEWAEQVSLDEQALTGESQARTRVDPDESYIFHRASLTKGAEITLRRFWKTVGLKEEDGGLWL